MATLDSKKSSLSNNTSPLVALVGNPNTGKSTLFNRLTGLRQHIANYPGVTVEKKSGLLRIGNQDLNLLAVVIKTSLSG